MTSILIAAVLLTQATLTIPPVQPHMSSMVNAIGYCTIDNDGVIKLENGTTQGECLRFIFQQINKSMEQDADRCEREKQHILHVWKSTLPPKVPKKKATVIPLKHLEWDASLPKAPVK